MGGIRKIKSFESTATRMGYNVGLIKREREPDREKMRRWGLGAYCLFCGQLKKYIETWWSAFRII